MGSIDFISTVNIGGDEISRGLARLETLVFVSRSMSSQQVFFVQIVGVQLGSSWVVLGKVKNIEILERGNCGTEIVVERVSEVLEVCLDEVSENSDGMVGILVELTVCQC